MAQDTITTTRERLLGARIGFDVYRTPFSFSAFLLSLGCLVLVVQCFVMTFNQGYAGLDLIVASSGVWTVEQVYPGGSAFLAGVHKGDRIVSVDRQGIGQLANGRARFGIGIAHRLSLVRAGEKIESEVILPRAITAGLWDPLVILILSLTFLFTGVAALLAQPRDPVVRALFLLNLAGAATTGVGVAADRGAFLLSQIEPALVLATSALLAHFFLIFPVRRRFALKSIPIIPAAVYVPPAIVLGLYVFSLVAMSDLQPIASSLVLLVFVSSFVIGTGGLVKGYRDLPPLESRQVQIVVVGTILALAPFVLLSIIPQAITGEYLLPPLTSIGFAVIMPFSFTYAILRHKILGIDLLVVRGLVYGLLTALLLGIYVAVIWAVLWPLDGPALRNIIDPGLVRIAGLVVAVLTFGGFRNRMTRWIDRVFYKDYYDYRETLLSLSASTATLQQPQRLASVLVSEVGRAMGLSAAALYSADHRDTLRPVAHWTDREIKDGDGTDETGAPPGAPHAIPSQITGLDGGALAVPLIHRGRPVGVLVLGEKRSGVRFRSVDVDLLSTLASHAAIAFENARLFDEVGKAEALREMTRLKNEFTAMLGHELRNPLTPILGYAELLSHRDCPPDSVREMARTMHASAKQLHRLVEDLLDLSRLERTSLRLEKVEVDLTALVEETATGFVRSDRHRLSLHSPRMPILVYLDPQRITQVLTNLLSNAVRYSPSGGAIDLALVQDDSMAIVTVTDQGIGIPLKEHERVFEKFYRVQSEDTAKISGTGLGLAVCKYIVEAHSGSIWVESEVGKGSTFFVSLPLLNPP